MPKQKTHKGLKKRFKITASGKIMHKRANSGHLMSGKNGKRRRRLRGQVVLKERDARRLREHMGR